MFQHYARENRITTKKKSAGNELIFQIIIILAVVGVALFVSYAPLSNQGEATRLAVRTPVSEVVSSHLECINLTCTSVPGQGNNTCSNVGTACSVCGDGVCNLQENSNSCLTDCADSITGPSIGFSGGSWTVDYETPPYNLYGWSLGYDTYACANEECSILGSGGESILYYPSNGSTTSTTPIGEPNSMSSQLVRGRDDKAFALLGNGGKTYHYSNGVTPNGYGYNTIPGYGATHYDNIAINPVTGLPVIVDNSGHNIIFCGNINCSNGNTEKIIEEIYEDPAIAIDRDGLPFIVSYSGYGLVGVKCDSSDCALYHSVVIDSQADSGGQAEVEIITDAGQGIQEVPIIAYRSPQGIKAVRCSTNDCATKTTTGINFTGNLLAMAPGVNQSPIVIYDHGDGIRIVSCTISMNCSATRTISLPAPSQTLYSADIVHSYANQEWQLGIAFSTDAGIYYHNCVTTDCMSPLNTTSTIVAATSLYRISPYTKVTILPQYQN